MASAAQVLSIKHVQLLRHLTVALRVQERDKLALVCTVVVLLIVWHPRGLHGVLALTPVAQVSVRKLNYRSFFRRQIEIGSEKTNKRFPSSFPVSLTLSCNLENLQHLAQTHSTLNLICSVIRSSPNNTLELLSHNWFFSPFNIDALISK